jgi:hypothetical protein
LVLNELKNIAAIGFQIDFILSYMLLTVGGGAQIEVKS